MAQREVHKITVALAGNPNVGKSTLFNTLTGLHQHTGNWPGKTVSVAQGKLRLEEVEYSFIDLPGTYSLEGKSEDERIASDYLESGEADCTVVVCDGSCLERSLILGLQIMARTERVVVCVNLMDEAQAQGIRVDRDCLEAELGVRVVLTAAGRGQGVRELLDAVIQTTREPGQMLPYFPNPIDQAQEITRRCVERVGAGSSWRKVLDRVVVSRRYGIPGMVLLLVGMIWLTVWGANYPSMLLERLFDAVYRWLWLNLSWMPGWLRGVLVDGVYATAAQVIAVMLPPMAIFFPLFTILEDVGYLPRMVFLMDHGMRRCGGCGKQALTLCMGLGCNAVGVMGCRIIDSPRERLAAILTNAMMPCNGRFPTLILLGSLFFPDAGAAVLVAACVALGAAGAMAASGVLNKTVLKRSESTFMMELPPFRSPRLGQIIVRSLLDRTLRIAARALTVAAPMGAVLWVLANTSLLGKTADILDPVGSALGMNGVIFLGFLLSLPANELLIPVILMVLTQSGSLRGAAGFGSEVLLRSGLTWQMAVCTMVFTLFHWPCATTLLTIYRETGSVKKTAAAFFLPTAVGVSLCFMLNLVFRGM